MVQIGIQLYTLRSLEEPTSRLVRRVAETPFEGVELAGIADPAVCAVARALAETETAVAGAHVGLDAIEDALDETQTRYARLGCDRLVIPRLDTGHFEDGASVRAAADRLNGLARDLALWDVDLCYHNHVHEFVSIDAGVAFDVFVESLDDRVGIELDVGWATAADTDPVALFDRLGPRVPLVHVKDVDQDGRPVELGSGVVDLDECVEAAIDAGASWLIYEHDDPPDPRSSLDHGATTLDALRDAFDR